MAPFAGGAAALAMFVALAGACTASGPDVPSASEAADEFIAAWNTGDFETMGETLAEGSEPADASGIEAFTGRALKSGDVESFQVDRDGEVDTPPDDAVADATDPVTVAVPYSITYASGAATGIPPLEGSFEMTYAQGRDAWVVEFDKVLLWPGIEGARSFSVDGRFGRRGRILDRKGAVLARGSATGRTYPFGALAGNTIGNLEPLSTEALKDAVEGHRAGDLVGGSGLEAAYEERLGGTPTTRLRVMGVGGKALQTLGTREGVPGRDVRSTLDIRVQRAASGAFGGTVGGAVVIQPRSGDILAAVSAFEIDPNNYVGIEVAPFNRALSGLYPPGSSMKVVTSAAALDTGVVTPSTQLTGPKEYQGVRNFESESFASLDFATALKFSVNTAFAQVAQKLGAKRLTEYAERFGFNRAPDMPLGAATPSFPFPEDEGDLMWGSIGQAQDLATPLQMATVAATVANHGVRMEPRSSGADDKGGRRVMSKRSASTLTGLMEGVVQGGTGVNARIDGVSVAGKTGTAEVDVDGKRKNHAWFIAFAPARAPQVAVGVVSEYGGVGGVVAAPIARNILVGVLPLTER